MHCEQLQSFIAAEFAVVDCGVCEWEDMWCKGIESRVHVAVKDKLCVL